MYACSNMRGSAVKVAIQDTHSSGSLCTGVISTPLFHIPLNGGGGARGGGGKDGVLLTCMKILLLHLLSRNFIF